MPKKSTVITAKKNTCCPLCSRMIKKGERTMVYNGGWYHYDCCEEVKFSIRKRRELSQLY